MLKRLFLTAGLASLGFAGWARTIDPVTLAWKPQVGMPLHYTTKMNAQLQGQDMVATSSETDTVKSIDGSTVTTTGVEDNFSIMVGGNDLSNSPGVPSSITSTTQTGIDGHLISKVTDSPEGPTPRVDSISQFVFPDHPVNVGDTWSYKGKGDAAKKSYDYEIDYTYQGTETADGISSNKFGVTFKEMNVPDGTLPMTGTGTMWLDATTGDLVKAAFTVKNAEMGALPPVDMTLALDRKS